MIFVYCSFEVKGQTGILGHQTKEAALACLENCPLLENMAEWSQWTIVFEPQLGKLRDFIQKYGECQTWPLEGKGFITVYVQIEKSFVLMNKCKIISWNINRWK